METSALVLCPHCRQKYSVPTEKLGRVILCRKCSKSFKLELKETVDYSEAEPPAPEPEPEKTEPAGFLNRVKAFAENVKQQVADHKTQVAECSHPSITEMQGLKFITGPVELKPNTGVYLHVGGGDVVLYKLKEGFNFSLRCDEVLRVPLASIKHLEIETAERMSLGRVGAGLLLAGPIGAVFGGFGFKKQDKFLRIDFDDAGMDASIVLGGKVQLANNKIMAERREAVSPR